MILAAAVSPQADERGIGTRIRERFSGLDWEDIPRIADAPRVADFAE
jgi:hypothetical protein